MGGQETWTRRVVGIDVSRRGPGPGAPFTLLPFRVPVFGSGVQSGVGVCGHYILRVNRFKFFIGLCPPYVQLLQDKLGQGDLVIVKVYIS